MASPVLESFCCFFKHQHQNENKSHALMVSIPPEFFAGTPVYIYNIFCTFFATVGICGALYQLSPRQPRVNLRTQRETDLFLGQNYIITWLTLADLLAASGILLRSALWLSGAVRIDDPSILHKSYDTPHQALENQTDSIALHHNQSSCHRDTNVNEKSPECYSDFSHIFCAVNAAWFQYFYICTYMWTFCYALDLYLFVSNISRKWWLYQCLGWLVSMVLAGGGLISLYYPSLLNCVYDVSHLLPHFLSSYLPILFVMAVNPLLFRLSSMKVRDSLRSLGTYTDHEREAVRHVQRKFCLLTVAFYVCWTPNVLNGFLLIFADKINLNVFLVLWIIMAVVNPMQALFNALLYQKVAGCYCYISRHLVNHDETDEPSVQDFTVSLEQNITDTSSLLALPRQ